LKRLFILLQFACIFTLNAQELDSTSIYPFVNHNINVIENATALDGFYQKLLDIKNKKREQLTVVHIGDSHIQADVISRAVREGLQNDFGNAGRGLIFPCKVAKSNEPYDIATSSTGSWQNDKIVKYAETMAIGLCGRSLKTETAGSELLFKIKNSENIDNSINKISIFYNNSQNSFGLNLKCDSRQENASWIEDKDSLITVYKFINFVNDFSIKTQQVNTKQNSFVFYGCVLENGKPGILYNSIGVNGAAFESYAVQLDFLKQVTLLQPDLIIISLGTNDSYGKNFEIGRFYDAMSGFINSLKVLNPTANFLMTVPPHYLKKEVVSKTIYLKKKKGKKRSKLVYKKVYLENPSLDLVREAIIDYSLNQNLAYWDLYNIMGGKGSMNKWLKVSLARPDNIHFSTKGYEIQGDLLLNAFMKGFESYVNRVK